MGWSDFVLLVGHEELPQSATELAGLCRAKDTIERYFRTIKSEIELRPLYHRTDEKIRAHVTVCMLALLLERSLETRLTAAGRPMTAAACLEVLEICRLNRYSRDEVLTSYYTVTRPDAEQKAILRSLGLSDLANSGKIGERLVARPV